MVLKKGQTEEKQTGRAKKKTAVTILRTLTNIYYGIFFATIFKGF